MELNHIHQGIVFRLELVVGQIADLVVLLACLDRFEFCEDTVVFALGPLNFHTAKIGYSCWVCSSLRQTKFLGIFLDLFAHGEGGYQHGNPGRLHIHGRLVFTGLKFFFAHPVGLIDLSGVFP